MKRFLFLFLAIAGSLLARSQTVGVTRYDSTIYAPPAGKLGNEVIIQNATRARTGAFLQNYNQGRTRFAYAVDSVWIASGSLYARRGDTTLVYGLPSGTGTALTPEDVQDIIGGILGPEFSYNDAANLITVNAIDWSKISGKPPVVSFETDPTVPAWVKSITTANIAYWNGKQDALGFTPENVANKSPFSSLGLSNTLYPTQRAVKVYVDSLFSTVAATGSDSVFHYVFPLYDSSGYIKIAGYNANAWNEVYNWYQSNPLAPYATILQLNTKQDKLGFTPVPDTFSLTINGTTKRLTGSGQTFTIPGGTNGKDSIYFRPEWFYIMAGENGAIDTVFANEWVDSTLRNAISRQEAYENFLKISDYNPQNIFNADLQQGASHTHDASGYSLNFVNGDSLQLGYNHIFLQAPATDLPTDSAYYRDENGSLQYGPINAPPQVNADWTADEGPAMILNKPGQLSDFENDLNFVTSPNVASFTAADTTRWGLGQIYTAGYMLSLASNQFKVDTSTLWTKVVQLNPATPQVGSLNLTGSGTFGTLNVNGLATVARYVSNADVPVFPTGASGAISAYYHLSGDITTLNYNAAVDGELAHASGALSSLDNAGVVGELAFSGTTIPASNYITAGVISKSIIQGGSVISRAAGIATGLQLGTTSSITDYYDLYLRQTNNSGAAIGSITNHYAIYAEDPNAKFYFGSLNDATGVTRTLTVNNGVLGLGAAGTGGGSTYAAGTGTTQALFWNNTTYAPRTITAADLPAFKTVAGQSIFGTGDISAGSTFTPTLTTSAATALTLATTTDTYVYTGGAAATWTMPAVSGNTAKVLYLINKGTDVVTLSGTLWADGNTTAAFYILPGDAAQFQNDGTTWTKRF